MRSNMINFVRRETGLDFERGLTPLQKKYCEIIDEGDHFEGIKICENLYVVRSLAYAFLDPVSFVLDYQNWLNGEREEGNITEQEEEEELEKVGYEGGR